MPNSSTHEMARIHAVVYGRVQGVNFRATTSQQAIMLGIGGWVRNCVDGTVETVAEGPKLQLSRFLDYLHEGPRSASVEYVEVTWEDFSNEFERFQIHS